MKWWKNKKNKQIIIKWICWRCLPNLIGIGLVEEGEIKKKKYQIDRWFNVHFHFHPKLFCFCVQYETQSAVNLTFTFSPLIFPQGSLFYFHFLKYLFLFSFCSPGDTMCGSSDYAKLLKRIRRDRKISAPADIRKIKR